MSDEFGSYFTDESGRALYIFANDTENTSNCSGTCAENWPPFEATGSMELPAGVSGTLDTITRDDGTTQVTYNGMPLYYYIGDTAPGDTNGQGVGDVWELAAPES